MASFSAELRVASYVFPLSHCTYGTSQATDARGRVTAKVRHSLVQLVLDVPEGDFLVAWAANPHKRYAADIVFRNAAGGSTIETLSLAAAYCVGYREVFVMGDATSGAYQCHLNLSDPDGWTLHPGGPGGALRQPAAGTHGTPPAAVAATAAANAPAGLTKQQRYDARLKKLDAAKAKLAQEATPLTPTPSVPADATRVSPSGSASGALRQQHLADVHQQADHQRLQAATDRLARNNVAVERAKLADDAYENEVGPGPDGKPAILRKHAPPEGWQVDRVIEDKASGFMAVVYKSDFERPPRPVMAFRGTDVGQGNDVKTDFLQSIGLDTSQYRETEDVATDLAQEFKEGFDITGHSLGGSEASLAGLLTGQDTYTFNAAGLHVNTMARAGIDPNAIALSQRKIQAYYSTHDPLSLPQDNPLIAKAFIHSLLVVPEAVVPPLGPIISPIIDNPNTLPGAVGIRRAFKDAGMHPIPLMVARIEQQKDEDLATIDQLVPSR